VRLYQIFHPRSQLFSPHDMIHTLAKRTITTCARKCAYRMPLKPANAPVPSRPPCLGASRTLYSAMFSAISCHGQGCCSRTESYPNVRPPLEIHDSDPREILQSIIALWRNTEILDRTLIMKLFAIVCSKVEYLSILMGGYDRFIGKI